MNIGGTPTWLEQVLENDEVTDLCLIGHDLVFAGYRGEDGLRPCHDMGFGDEKSLRSWIAEQLSAAGKGWDARQPFIDIRLTAGHRMHAIFPPLATQGVVLSIRRHTQWSSPAASPWRQDPAYVVLREALLQKKNIIIAGATGSGKTTLLNTLLDEIPENQRFITLEDTAEIRTSHPQWVSLLSRAANSDTCGEVTLRTLLKQALRMRPDRIILGECRGEEVLDLLQALNTGHGGSLATLHANSPRDSLKRLELLCQLASDGHMEGRFLKELLHSGIQVLVQIRREHGKRRIGEISRIAGFEGDMILLQSLYEEGRTYGAKEQVFSQIAHSDLLRTGNCRRGLSASASGFH